MNKLFKLAASAVMLASMCTPVLAAPLVSDDGIHYTESTIDTTATGSLTIQKLLRGEFVTHQGTGQPEDVSKRFKIGGVKFKVAKIADIADNVTPPERQMQRSSNDAVLGSYYTNITSEYGFDEAVKNRTQNDTGYYTANELETLIAEIASDAEGKAKLGTFSGTELTTAYDGTAKFDSLPLGLYLVVETDTSGAYIDRDGGGDKDTNEAVTISSTTDPYLVSIPMTNQAVIDEHAVGTVWQYDVTSYPKNSTTEAYKTIVEEREWFQGTENMRSSADYMIGEEHSYMVTSTLPKRETGEATYTAFTINDSAEGLAIDYKNPLSTNGQTGSVEVQVNDAIFEYGTDYTVTGTQYKTTERSTDIKVIFTASGLSKLNTATSTKNTSVVLRYSAYITPESVVGSTSENTNEAEFAWTFSNGGTGSVKTNKTQVYTYGIQLTKTGVDNPENVKFTVEAEEYTGTILLALGVNMQFYKVSDGVYRVATSEDTAESLVEEISPSSTGTLQVNGLDDAYCYKFTEVATDVGANLMSEPFIVYISGERDNGTLNAAYVSIGETQVENSFSENGTRISSDDGYAYLTVENTPAPILETGGRGLIAVIAIAGAAGVFAISFYILYKRAKKEEEEEESSEQE